MSILADAKCIHLVLLCNKELMLLRSAVHFLLCSSCSIKSCVQKPIAMEFTRMKYWSLHGEKCLNPNASTRIQAPSILLLESGQGRDDPLDRSTFKQCQGSWPKNLL